MALFQSNRNDNDETEAKMNLLLKQQTQIEEKLTPLGADLERTLNERLKQCEVQVETQFEKQKEWLEGVFKEVDKGFEEETAKQTNAILEGIQRIDAQQKTAMEALEARLEKRFERLENQNRAVQSRITEFEAQWQKSEFFEMDDESPESLAQWQEELRKRLIGFNNSDPMPRAFAFQLFQVLKGLTAFGKELSASSQGWEGRLDELQRLFAAPETGLSWTALTPLNSNAVQRKTLRALETAIAQFRGLLQERLRREAGISLLEIVPGYTHFDPKQHESSEFLEVPTGDESKDNLILEIERPGFIQTTSEAVLTLQAARVRRFVWKNDAPKTNPSAFGEILEENSSQTIPFSQTQTPQLEQPLETAPEEIAPIKANYEIANPTQSDEASAPRVTGQL